jgi:hypothetical protein
MPWQLRNAKRRPRHSEPRPIAETLPRINVNDLGVPRDYKTYTSPNISFSYPHLSNMRIAYNMVQFAHSGRVQSFRLKWIKTGFGLPRPAFICECGRPTIRLYFRHQHLACRRCTKALYASQVCGKRTRPVLQSIRLHSFIKLKHYMRKNTRQRLQSRLNTLPKPSQLQGKRLALEITQRPHSNYNTQATPLWS